MSELVAKPTAVAGAAGFASAQPLPNRLVMIRIKETLDQVVPTIRSRVHILPGRIGKAVAVRAGEAHARRLTEFT